MAKGAWLALIAAGAGLVVGAVGAAYLTARSRSLAGEFAGAGASKSTMSDGARERKPLFYRHPMRPDVTSPVPAKDEMGMDYLPVYDDGAASGSTVAGRASFELPLDRQQLIGVTRGTVEWRALEVDVRAAGRIAYDPALYEVVVEYREALRSQQQMGSSSLREGRDGADAIVRAAKLKLRQKGLSEDQIARIGTGAADPIDLLLPNDAVWVYAQVFESDAGLVRPGQTMTLTTPSQPGRQLASKVTAIDPILDAATRTVRVRGLVRTPDQSLRPESFVQVTIHVPLGEKLAVPREAVLETGTQQIVFVSEGEGRFEPRAVTIGRAAGDYFEVLSGLRKGEQVVTSANFLIDSESRFRAALTAFKRPSLPVTN